MNLLGLLILLIVYVLLDSIILFEKFRNQLPVFLSLDFELISLLLDFNDLFPLSVEHLLHFLHGPFEFSLLFLAFFELPLNSMHKVLFGANLLKLLIPLHTIFLESLDPLSVISQDLSHMNA